MLHNNSIIIPIYRWKNRGPKNIAMGLWSCRMQQVGGI